MEGNANAYDIGDFIRSYPGSGHIDFLVLATNEMIVMLSFSQITDRMGLVDFHVLPSAFEDVVQQLRC